MVKFKRTIVFTRAIDWNCWKRWSTVNNKIPKSSVMKMSDRQKRDREIVF